MEGVKEKTGWIMRKIKVENKTTHTTPQIDSIVNLSKEHRCKNPQQKTSKLNSTLY